MRVYVTGAGCCYRAHLLAGRPRRLDLPARFPRRVRVLSPPQLPCICCRSPHALPPSLAPPTTPPAHKSTPMPAALHLSAPKPTALLHHRPPLRHSIPLPTAHDQVPLPISPSHPASTALTATLCCGPLIAPLQPFSATLPLCPPLPTKLLSISKSQFQHPPLCPPPCSIAYRPSLLFNLTLQFPPPLCDPPGGDHPLRPSHPGGSVGSSAHHCSHSLEARPPYRGSGVCWFLGV